MDKNSVEAQRDLQTITAPINPNPILILGNQKSGTSAIAALLAELTGLSATLDLKKEFPIPTYPQILKGQLPFSQFLQNYKLDFSRDIVKEPNLTYSIQNWRSPFLSPSSFLSCGIPGITSEVFSTA